MEQPLECVVITRLPGRKRVANRYLITGTTTDELDRAARNVRRPGWYIWRIIFHLGDRDVVLFERDQWYTTGSLTRRGLEQLPTT